MSSASYSTAPAAASASASSSTSKEILELEAHLVQLRKKQAIEQLTTEVDKDIARLQFEIKDLKTKKVNEQQQQAIIDKYKDFTEVPNTES